MCIKSEEISEGILYVENRCELCGFSDVDCLGNKDIVSINY